MLSAAWLVYALVTGTLVGVTCAAADAVLRGHARVTRWVWVGGLGVIALLALLALCGAAIGTRAHAPALSGALAGRPSASVTPTPVGSAFERLVATLDAARTGALGFMVRSATVMPGWLGRRLGACWLLSTTLSLLGVGLVHRRVARLRQRWPAAALFGHPVHIAPDVGPAVLGLVRAFIVVPRWLLARSADEQRLVMAHEMEHVRAYDHLLLAFASLVVALMPWHPAAWWMRARLRLAVELDCDARVLRHGVPARAYGGLLIDLAGQCSGNRLGATALADESSHLQRRLIAMTPIASRTTRLRALTLSAAGALALLAACEIKAPTAADVQNMDVASAEKGAQSIRLLEGGSAAHPTYYVNGVVTDAQAAHAIAATRIASVQVTKTSGASEVRISTQGTNTLTMPARQRDPFAGLYLIDGVRADAAAVNALDPGAIASVEVIKGPAAVLVSSDAAATNGIIRVTTKPALRAR